MNIQYKFVPIEDATLLMLVGHFSNRNEQLLLKLYRVRMGQWRNSDGLAKKKNSSSSIRSVVRIPIRFDLA